MKKVLFSFAVAALMVAVSACGNNSNKAAEATEAPEMECCADTTACTGEACDSTSCEMAADTTAVVAE